MINKPIKLTDKEFIVLIIEKIKSYRRIANRLKKIDKYK